jgi:hypothetical protein
VSSALSSPACSFLSWAYAGQGVAVNTTADCSCHELHSVFGKYGRVKAIKVPPSFPRGPLQFYGAPAHCFLDQGSRVFLYRSTTARTVSKRHVAFSLHHQRLANILCMAGRVPDGGTARGRCCLFHAGRGRRRLRHRSTQHRHGRRRADAGGALRFPHSPFRLLSCSVWPNSYRPRWVWQTPVIELATSASQEPGRRAGISLAACIVASSSPQAKNQALFEFLTKDPTPGSVRVGLRPKPFRHPQVITR